ncbi:hypothetical protein ACFZAR_41375 [Streptomyces sp. NPDC008222]|uniref:hypothetical protein n=1 Tax=Streptomyces sp. NPDC008222 TaxID=3364820 RepID=UPI0036ECB2E9
MHLDGTPDDAGCVTIINKTSTIGVIESVSFTVVDGPEKAAVRSDAAAHCEPTGDPPCQEVRVKTGYQCLAGAVLPSNAPEGDYTVQPAVHFRYVCVNAEDAPCNEVKDWKGPPPTAESPVEVSGWTTNNVPQVTMHIGASSPSPDTSTDTSDAPSEEG